MRWLFGGGVTFLCIGVYVKRGGLTFQTAFSPNKHSFTYVFDVQFLLSSKSTHTRHNDSL